MEGLLMGLSYMIEANIKKPKIIAIIPARGGSKRLHRKNISLIWGKPMISWVINEAKKSEYIDEVWVTTEDDEIAEIAKLSGARIHKRPAELSKDNVYKMEAIRECFDCIKSSQNTNNYIVVSLQANSPEIKSEILDGAIKTFIDHDRNELISVGPNMMQNAAFRIMKDWYVFQKDLSTKTGVYMCDLIDVHTEEDVKSIEARNKK
jgi:CMP-N-acetylneuraminic acid synthetase